MYLNELSGKLIGGIDNRPDCADQICALAQAIGPHKKLQDNLVKWVVNPDNLTFEWAVYTVIKTLIMQKCKNRLLETFCKKRLVDPISSDPIKGISAVYLNIKSKSETMRQITNTNSFFLQRHFIIALSKVKPVELRKHKVAGKIIQDYTEHHTNLNKLSSRGDFEYIRGSERLVQRVLIKELNNYA